VSVVIPSYNHAEFLGAAIESVLSQTIQDCEIIVVDDGSTDNTREVAARYTRAKYIFQTNQGLSAARNTGIKHATGQFLVFLDADDLLMPSALEAGLECFQENPGSAFVSGVYRRIRKTGEVFFTYARPEIKGGHYLAFLRGNYIGMHATVMYKRKVFEQIGGFDTTLRACEDYDMYLRISRDHPVATHDKVVAEYRIHGENMSGNLALMVRYSTRVVERQRSQLRNGEEQEAFRMGLNWWREYYAGQMFRRLGQGKVARRMIVAARTGLPLFLEIPGTTGRMALQRVKAKLREFARKVIPLSVRRVVRPSRRPGKINLGDIRKLEPVSRCYGFDRGLPIDRYYIEKFLTTRAEDIQGRTLEIGDNEYTMRYGSNRVKQSDVLHVREGNPKATFVGDISKGDNLPGDAFDCVILTQTLHLVYDLHAAIATLYRILKPGGVLLMTVPGTISQIEEGTWSNVWHWGFTGLSIRKLIEEKFKSEHVQIDVHGNVLASISFLEGLAAEELRVDELDFRDPLYPLLITVSARKQPAGGSTRGTN
jgi:glycosyltransferase involved in cell wall biosynthesis